MLLSLYLAPCINVQTLLPIDHLQQLPPESPHRTFPVRWYHIRDLMVQSSPVFQLAYQLIEQLLDSILLRSEERRVGKECRPRGGERDCSQGRDHGRPGVGELAEGVRQLV